MENSTGNIMKQVKERLLLKKLESVYNRASQSAIPHIFFGALIEYVSLFEHSQILNAIAREIVEEGKNQTAPIRELEKITLDELQSVYEEIKNFVVENAIIDGEIAFSLEGASGQLAANLNHVEYRYQALGDLLYILSTRYSTHSKAFVSKFAKIDEAAAPKDNVIVSTVYSTAYNKWHDAYAKHQRQKITEPWFSWKEIYELYRNYHDYEIQRKELIDRGKTLERMSHSYTFQKVYRLVNDSNQTTENFEAMELYRTYIERVHFHVQSLLEGLEQNVEVEEISKPKIPFHFNAESGVLEINKKKVTFRGAPKSLLTILTNEPRKEWPYDELYELLESIQITKLEDTMKEKVYRTCKAITDRVALETEAKEFLMYKGQTARINPIFISN